MTAIPLAVASAALGEQVGGWLVEPAGEPHALVLLLHGRGGEAADWLGPLGRLDLPPCVVVLPDAPWSERASWYVDSPAPGGRPVATALVEVVEALAERYPALATRARRIAGGYSMGGAGALRLALARPDLFGSLIAMSPGIYAPPVPAESSMRLWGPFGRGERRFDDEVYEALHYRHLLAGAPGLRAFVDVGNAADLTREAEIVAGDLAGAGAEVTFRIRPGGHDFSVWAPALEDALRALVTA